MPKEMEEKLKKMAKEQGLSGERLKAYVYSTMRKMGYIKTSPQRQGPSTKEKK